MRKKWLMILCTSMLAIGMLGGCGEKEQAAAQAEETETPTPTVTETPEATPTEEAEEEILMYTLAEKVPVYAENNKKSEKLAKLGVNIEVAAVGEEGKWCEVKIYDIDDEKKTEGEDYLHGFIQRKYLTLDPDEAEKMEETILKEKEEAEKAAAEAQAAAEEEAKRLEAEAKAKAEAEAQAAAVSEVTENGQEVTDISETQNDGAVIEEVENPRTEVSRQNYDDCDGSGHGYTIITYSDGTEEKVYY